MRIYKPNEEIPIRDYIARKLKVIKNEIKSLSNDYIQNVNQEEYINMLVSKHTISFEIYYATEQLIRERIIEKQEHFDEWLGYYGGGRLHTYTEHQFCLKYKFSGDIDVLRIEPKSFSFSTLYNPIPIDVLGDEIQIRFSAREIDAVKIKKQIEEIKRNEFGNLDNERGAQWHISQYNARLPQEIKTIFESIKAVKEKEQQELSKLGIFTPSETKVEVPIIRKKVSPPILVENKEVAYRIKDDVYREILTHIYRICKEYEQHESTYRGRHEEELRDLIITALNPIFIGTNSSAETFNRTGKTDIITKAPDGSNVFIAECKVWRGDKMFLEAIDQLLGYVTWRDTRTALILFVKNSGIADIIEKAKSTITQHPCYVSYKTKTGESSFAYIFHTKDDVQSQIALELMIFHYPE